MILAHQVHGIQYTDVVGPQKLKAVRIASYNKNFNHVCSANFNTGRAKR